MASLPPFACRCRFYYPTPSSTTSLAPSTSTRFPESASPASAPANATSGRGSRRRVGARGKVGQRPSARPCRQEGRARIRPCAIACAIARAAEDLTRTQPMAPRRHQDPPAMKGGKQYATFGAVTLDKAKIELPQRRKIIPEVYIGDNNIHNYFTEVNQPSKRKISIDP